MADTIIEARQVEKFYAQPNQNRIQVIAPTDLEIQAGEILALLGPSGSGKSTLLRMLTGLAPTSAGAVLWHGRPVGAEPPNVSIVFQSFALFPWLTVVENVEAPLKARGVAQEERRERAVKILDSVGLDGFEAAYPKELSGGMKQRVGFARALVVEPEVLFMDEPFSALDVLTAENLRGELLELWQRKSMPTRAVFIVTHNIEEAVLLADRIVVLGKNPGRIRTDFQVTLAHPRDKKSKAFLDLVDYIYTVLTRPEDEPGEAPTGKPAAPRYQMLPHARPAGVTGLVEMLEERGGRADISALADDLAFELDDLLPIVDATILLGFAKVAEGDVEMTAEGQAFAEADILTRKDLFRHAATTHANLIRQITRSLATKRNHTLPDEFFHDILDEHFSEEETARQLETAVHWGRYAELFDHDAEERRFFLPEETEEKE
jgi:NitT/TauT family transport system ATP-binding protein